MAVRPSARLWTKEGGYYTEYPEQLRRNPLLPDLKRFRDRRYAALFDRYANLRPESLVLEVGCGRSIWLPYLAEKLSCSVVGIDMEAYAAELARANLAGAGVEGTILCGDGFAPEDHPELQGRFDLVYSIGVVEHFDNIVGRLHALSRYLKPGGRILTTVPNLQGVNGILQRLADRERLEMHVIYDPPRLARVHEEAGFTTLAAGYVGWCDGHLTVSGASAGRLKRAIHRRLCWALAMLSEAWVKAFAEMASPELPFLAPHIFYAGHRGDIS